MLTFEVEKINAASKPLEETHVDEDPGGMKLDVASVLGAVVRVVPLVGRQQQLHQRVGRVGVTQSCLVSGRHSNTRHGLQHEAEQMLRDKSTPPPP